MTNDTLVRYRPDRAVLADVTWRVVLVVLAALAVALELPAWARIPMSSVAALATGIFFLRRYRRRGFLDALLTAAGGGIVLLALLGLVLNYLPGGLSVLNWGIGVAVVEVAVLLALAVVLPPLPVRSPTRRRLPLVSLAWAAGVIAVLVGALGWSVASFDATHVEPLAIAAEPSGDSFVVTVTSGREEGPFELDLVTSAGRSKIADAISVGPDTDYAISLTLPADTRGQVELVKAGSTTSVRELILDTTDPAGATE